MRSGSMLSPRWTPPGDAASLTAINRPCTRNGNCRVLWCVSHYSGMLGGLGVQFIDMACRLPTYCRPAVTAFGPDFRIREVDGGILCYLTLLWRARTTRGV